MIVNRLNLIIKANLFHISIVCRRFFRSLKEPNSAQNYVLTERYVLLKQGKGAERCDYVFDAHTSKKASKELKVLQLHLWRVNVKTIGGFIYISLEDLHMDKTAT